MAPKGMWIDEDPEAVEAWADAIVAAIKKSPTFDGARRGIECAVEALYSRDGPLADRDIQPITKAG